MMTTTMMRISELCVAGGGREVIRTFKAAVANSTLIKMYFQLNIQTFKVTFYSGMWHTRWWAEVIRQ